MLNYPIISDSVQTFKSNDYGQKTIQLGNNAYQTLTAPLLPWFSKPYQYVSPYVQKVDFIGDKSLDRIDERFPVVKKPTEELYDNIKVLILLPYQKGLEGKDHVLQVYISEYKKNEQPGLVAHGKTALTTVLVVSNETLSWLSAFLSAKKAQTSEAVNEKINQ